jgi:hypothetical protein
MYWLAQNRQSHQVLQLVLRTVEQIRTVYEGYGVDPGRQLSSMPATDDDAFVSMAG